MFPKEEGEWLSLVSIICLSQHVFVGDAGEHKETRMQSPCLPTLWRKTALTQEKHAADRLHASTRNGAQQRPTQGVLRTVQVSHGSELLCRQWSVTGLQKYS